jgi:hypothetical protein
VVVDRLRRQEQTLGDVAVAQAVGDQREHLKLSRGELRRVLARRLPRAAWEVRHAALAQPPAHDRGRRTRTERAQRVEGPGAGPPRHPRRRARAPPRTGSPDRPSTRGLLERARELERVGLGDLLTDLLRHAGPPPPARELADHPARVAAPREREHVLRLGHDPGAIARQPGRLGAGRRDRLDALQLGTGEGERLVQRCPRLRVAAARAQAAAHHVREDHQHRGGALRADHERGGLGRPGQARPRPERASIWSSTADARWRESTADSR